MCEVVLTPTPSDPISSLLLGLSRSLTPFQFSSFTSVNNWRPTPFQPFNDVTNKGDIQTYINCKEFNRIITWHISRHLNSHTSTVSCRLDDQILFTVNFFTDKHLNCLYSVGLVPYYSFLRSRDRVDRTVVDLLYPETFQSMKVLHNYFLYLSRLRDPWRTRLFSSRPLRPRLTSTSSRQ